ncbi:MAG: HAD family hydrolase [Dysgonamonadaceae bacterium]|jgi:phosphoglycolate phosphatase|nr:HAD family hydrolase [Dysgonamonadaceae bacterium]
MKTIILDFDGTIADTRNSIIQTLQNVAEKLGLPNANESDIKNLIGLPLRDTFIQAYHISNENDLQNAIKLYRTIYNEFCLNTVELYPNVKSTLETLFSKNIILTVASSKGKDVLSVLLKRLEIIEYITLVLGEQDVTNKKPAPDMVLRILEETKTLPKDALVVGDTIYDIEMGQRAECVTCGVTYGNHNETQLKEQGADFIINDFIKLIDLKNIRKS